MVRNNEKEPKVRKYPKPLKPAWRFLHIDFEGPFRENHFLDDDPFMRFFDIVYEKLLDYESKTWAQIKSEPHNHPMPFNKIEPQAKKRIDELELNDFSHLDQLKIQGLQRVWGIRIYNTLNILWWDPEHKVYKTRGRR